MGRDALVRLRLLQSADSSFPSGTFAFSSGLESLANEKRIRSAQDVSDILETQIVARWLEFDRVFLGMAHAAAENVGMLLDLDWQCHVQSAADRLAEASRRVGRSLLSVHARIGTAHVQPYRAAIADAGRGDSAGYEPVVQGVVGAGLGLPLPEAEAGALHAVIMAFLSAAVRLGRLGAIEAQAVLADISPRVAEALDAPLPERPGSFAPYADIAALRRATSHTSLFAT